MLTLQVCQQMLDWLFSMQSSARTDTCCPANIGSHIPARLVSVMTGRKTTDLHASYIVSLDKTKGLASQWWVLSPPDGACSAATHSMLVDLIYSSSSSLRQATVLLSLLQQQFSGSMEVGYRRARFAQLTGC